LDNRAIEREIELFNLDLKVDKLKKAGQEAEATELQAEYAYMTQQQVTDDDI
jgi:hypothetical protein